MKNDDQNNMTKDRTQPFRRTKNINVGFFDGAKLFPRSVTDRDIALIFTIIIFV